MMPKQSGIQNTSCWNCKELIWKFIDTQLNNGRKKPNNWDWTFSSLRQVLCTYSYFILWKDRTAQANQGYCFKPSWQMTYLSLDLMNYTPQIILCQKSTFFLKTPVPRCSLKFLRIKISGMPNSKHIQISSPQEENTKRCNNWTQLTDMED